MCSGIMKRMESYLKTACSPTAKFVGNAKMSGVAYPKWFGLAFSIESSWSISISGVVSIVIFGSLRRRRFAGGASSSGLSGECFCPIAAFLYLVG